MWFFYYKCEPQCFYYVLCYSLMFTFIKQFENAKEHFNFARQVYYFIIIVLKLLYANICYCLILFDAYLCNSKWLYSTISQHSQFKRNIYPFKKNEFHRKVKNIVWFLIYLSKWNNARSVLLNSLANPKQANLIIETQNLYIILCCWKVVLMLFSPSF